MAPYMSDAPICQTPLFVRRPYLSDAPIFQVALLTLMKIIEFLTWL